MATVNFKTRTKGEIKTAQGSLPVVIKKAFKGALNYTVYIDGEAKFQDLEIKGACKKLKEYIAFWK